MRKLVRVAKSRSGLSAALGVLFSLLIATGVSARQDSQVRFAEEEKLRAAILLGIVRYTRWQQEASEAIDICLSGNAGSFPHLEALNGTRLVHNRALNVTRLNKENLLGIKSCQVLIMGRKSPLNFQNAQLRSSCLVICDECGALMDHASVVLMRMQNRIRFNVYLTRAREHGINFSAQMLELAAKVEGVGE